MRRLYETSAFKSVSAYVVMKGSKYIAKVLAHHGEGSCTVEVVDMTGGDGIQHGKARGYGYDRFSSALGGMVIDGHKLADNCGVSAKLPKGKKLFPESFRKKGYDLGNFRQVDGESGYISCYQKPGLKYLESLGYQVIQVI